MISIDSFSVPIDCDEERDEELDEERDEERGKERIVSYFSTSGRARSTALPLPHLSLTDYDDAGEELVDVGRELW